MKPESLVIANQLCGDEYVPESCTHRQQIRARQISLLIGVNPILSINFESVAKKNQQSKFRKEEDGGLEANSSLSV